MFKTKNLLLLCVLPLFLIVISCRTAEIPAEEISVLLVYDEEETAKRTAAFLQEREFPVTLTTTEMVTAEMCDSHDVVIAASRQRDMEFPETVSPLIGVGYSGADIIERKYIGMTCGYI
ncbi:hypothetical protein ACFL7D_02945 [candidate division KSB1 bacterium]